MNESERELVEGVIRNLCRARDLVCHQMTMDMTDYDPPLTEEEEDAEWARILVTEDLVRGTMPPDEIAGVVARLRKILPGLDWEDFELVSDALFIEHEIGWVSWLDPVPVFLEGQTSAAARVLSVFLPGSPVPDWDLSKTGLARVGLMFEGSRVGPFIACVTTEEAVALAPYLNQVVTVRGYFSVRSVGGDSARFDVRHFTYEGFSPVQGN